MPNILANALSVNMLIVATNGINYEARLLECQYSSTVRPRTLMLYKSGLHYDSIMPSGTLFVANGVQGADQRTSIECDNVPLYGKKVKHMWDLLTIININARSLNAEKVDELQVIVDDYDIAVACITDTWFREYMDNTSLALEGFCLERKDRGHRRGGGVACYIRNDVVYNRLLELEDELLEVLWIQVMPKRLPRKFSCILVGCLYYTHCDDYRLYSLDCNYTLNCMYYCYH